MKKLLTAVLLPPLLPLLWPLPLPLCLKLKKCGTACKSKGVWIDVRSAEEFKEGHLQGALNIPHDKIVERIKSVSPDKNAPVNLYCRSGRRAEAALTELKKPATPT